MRQGISVNGGDSEGSQELYSRSLRKKTIGSCIVDVCVLFFFYKTQIVYGYFDMYFLVVIYKYVWL